MIDVAGIAIPLACAGVSGAIGWLTKLALDDRDRRILELESDYDSLAKTVHALSVESAVTKTENAQLLRATEKISAKLDQISGAL